MRLRTGYSFRKAVGLLPDVVKKVEANNWPVFPMTDRASTFGFVRWKNAAKKHPVFGVELGVVESVHEKKPVIDYWTFLAIDDIGAINRLVALATQQFRYEPLLRYEDAMAAEGVLKMVGHRCKLDLIEPAPNVYYGLGPASAKGHVNRAIGKGLRLVATTDNFYPNKEDKGFYEILCGRGASTQTYDQHIQSDDEWIESVDKTGVSLDDRKEALQLRNDLWTSCRADLKVATLVQPERKKTLLEMCEIGAEKLGCDLTDEVYKQRLERELELIAQKEFEDYFYLVADLCQWARDRMAVGPARGSSCGSLVCYLLRITTVDPIPHGLIFERFIDINRSDLPDIDIDFSYQNRSMVFDYLGDKYGNDHVARLGTVSMYKARSALQEASAALRIPKWQIARLTDSLVERSSADSRATDTLEDSLKETPLGREILDEWPEIMVAAKMEGHPRHYSQHAAGAVVSSDPILDIVAVDHRTNATMCDKKDAEDGYGLLKIDCLGLTQLSVLEDALTMAGKTMQELEAVPKNDQKAFDVLNDWHFSGIFQWNGRAVQALSSQITIKTFDDIVAISALARPGPLATGGAGEWVKRRDGGEIPKGLHPLLDELTKDTFGVIVFQEQVMRVVREIGCMSWEDTSLIRKAMSRTLGNEFFEKFKAKFIEGAATKGVNSEIAGEIWDQINTFGSWAFNKSHAVAYGYISYWCCWLKAHHPFEFAAATLSHEFDPQKQIQLLRELKDEGISYIPVDPESSTDKWTASENALIGPLTSVKGIGPKMVQQIIHAREHGEKIPNRAQKLLEDPKTDIDSLYPVGDAINRCMPDPSEKNILTPRTFIKDIEPRKEPYETMVFCTPVMINPRDENESINLQRRNGQRIEDGKTEFLSMRLSDDTGMIQAKVNRFNFAKTGKQIIEKGRAGKSLWAFKGKVYTMGGNFMLLSINKARYIGDIDGEKD